MRKLIFFTDRSNEILLEIKLKKAMNAAGKPFLAFVEKMSCLPCCRNCS